MKLANIKAIVIVLTEDNASTHFFETTKKPNLATHLKDQNLYLDERSVQWEYVTCIARLSTCTHNQKTPHVKIKSWPLRRIPYQSILYDLNHLDYYLCTQIVAKECVELNMITCILRRSMKRSTETLFKIWIKYTVNYACGLFDPVFADECSQLLMIKCFKWFHKLPLKIISLSPLHLVVS